jgi:hypothetical protein
VKIRQIGRDEDAGPGDGASRRRAGRHLGGEQVTGTRNEPPPHRYRICVRGRLGETMRSAFPALQAEASGADTVLTAPRCTACSRRSRRSGSSCSKSAACHRRGARAPAASPSAGPRGLAPVGGGCQQAQGPAAGHGAGPRVRAELFVQVARALIAG